MRTTSQLHIADLAQLAEHLICNQRVSGSNPLIGMEHSSQVYLVGLYIPAVGKIQTYLFRLLPRVWSSVIKFLDYLQVYKQALFRVFSEDLVGEN